jgi:hypothetical protein
MSPTAVCVASLGNSCNLSWVPEHSIPLKGDPIPNGSQSLPVPFPSPCQPLRICCSGLFLSVGHRSHGDARQGPFATLKACCGVLGSLESHVTGEAQRGQDT